jgi:hypothetical protein
VAAGRNAHAQGMGGTMADSAENKREPLAVNNQYAFYKEELIEKLGLEGDKVVQIVQDSSTNLWYITTEKRFL